MSRFFLQVCFFVIAACLFAKVNAETPSRLHVNVQVNAATPRILTLRATLLELQSWYKVDILFEEEAMSGISVSSELLDRSATLERNLQVLLTPKGFRFKQISKNAYVVRRARNRTTVGEVESKSGFDMASPIWAHSVMVPVSGITSVTSRVLPDEGISGRVTDEKGDGLPGVSISIKGTTQGTTTDANGNYRISDVRKGSILVFSFVGYKLHEELIQDKTTINVSLIVDNKSLDEVVVVGYGTVKKSDLTGSVASINNTELNKTLNTSLDQSLQGRAAGVQVTQSNGQPGGGLSIRVRGGNSITGTNEPLYVIDGFPVGGSPNAGVSLGADVNPLASINPNDIASIEILKDASATAIYGARGANGVVMITTKRGKAGRSKIDYETYIGTQELVKQVPLLNARQYAELVNDARQQASLAPAFSQRALDSLNTAGTDWQAQIFRRAPIQNHQLTISGGNEKIQYAVAGNYFNQQGIIINSGFNRASVRTNLDVQVTDWLKIGTNLLFSRTNSQIVPTDAAGAGTPGVIWAAQSYSPLSPVFNPDGTYQFSNSEPAIGNPVAYARLVDNKSGTTRFLGSVFADLSLAKGLVLRINAGQDYSNNKESLYIPSNIFLGQPTKGQGTIGVIQANSGLLENTLTYKKKFNQHDFNVLAGYTIQTNQSDRVRASSQNYPFDQIGANNIGLGSTFLAPASNITSSKLVSYIGRVNYAYKERYLFTGTMRVDGSTRFGEGNKYGTFPSGSFAWRAIEEPFMERFSRVISDLKLRTSYGFTGNQAIPLYQSLPLLGGIQTVFNGSIAAGIAPTNISNPNLKWETTAQFDAGIDVGLWSNRVSITLDYYQKQTRDLLINITLPVTSGFETMLKNVGQVNNTGWEFSLSTINLDKKVRWTSSLNLTANRNKVVSLGSINQFLTGTALVNVSNYNIVRVGEPVGSFFGLINDGIFQNQSEIDASAQKTARPGDRRYRDLNGDGIIDTNDRTLIGNAQPKLFGGLVNTISYKGLELSVILNGVFGTEIFNVNRFRLYALGAGSGGATFSGASNNFADAVNRWTPTNPSQTISRANTIYPGDILSTFQIEDGSFVRVRNISLAYNLPSAFLQRIKLRNVRLYLSGQNLLTFTNYSGFDPEVSRFGQTATSAGIDFGGYPLAKLYTVGLNIGL